MSNQQTSNHQTSNDTDGQRQQQEGWGGEANVGTQRRIPVAVSTPCVMLAAGGTAGHLFPAYALAQELGRREIAVDLLTDTRGDRYGSDFPARAIYRVPAQPLAGRAVVPAIKAAWMMTRGIAATYQLLGTVKPGAVLGFGGYPTFAPLVAARLRKIPTALHEQNAVLGRANRALAGGATAIATSFARTAFLDARALAKTRLTGNPVRDAVTVLAQQGYRAPGPEGPFSLLIFGGSQGARIFADALPPALALLPPRLRANLFVVQQCREEDLQRVEAAYKAAEIRAHLATFFADLPEEMAKAHLVIGRAGASTVAELTVMGRPAILVPLPHSIDNDQRQNASRLAEAGGGWCMEQNDLIPQALADAIARLLQAPQALMAAAAAAKQLGRPNAVAALADLVVELIGSRVKNA
jgi:UDP-N-acetylglucosamine--N-acetylmuramyl-(pentapeptide) pyrophosphoryl-undecaprenol N-acetylglucosamine transferase